MTPGDQTLLLSLLSSGDHLVMSDTNYAGTAELARQTLPRLGIEVTAADTSDPEAVAAAFRPNIPSLRMVKALRRSRTWSSGLVPSDRKTL